MDKENTFVCVHCKRVLSEKNLLIGDNCITYCSHCKGKVTK